jgi:hypothetical protein
MELLNEDWQRELIAQPELGMGYQDVAIKLRDGETRYGTAFNAEFLLYSENQRRFWRGLANHPSDCSCWRKSNSAWAKRFFR